MSKIIPLNNVVNLLDATTAQTTINSNYTSITNAVNNTLSLDGSTPNQMQANLDMNSNQLLNLPTPVGLTSAARLVDVVTNPTILIPPTGTSGHTVPFLDGNNTFSGTNNFSGAIVDTSGSITATTFKVAGATSGTTSIVAASTASGSLTVPSATDTLVGKATTDTLTNKTLTAPVLSGTVTGTYTLGGTPSIAATAVTPSTGSGNNVLATSPTLVTPVLGAASATSLSLSTALSGANGGTGMTTYLVPGRYHLYLRSVNFNSANTDNALTIILPPGITNYLIPAIYISNASASITTATFGIFSAVSGGGSAIFTAGQAITVSTASANTANNTMVISPATFGSTTQSINFSTLYFRVGTAEGSAATADVVFQILPL